MKSTTGLLIAPLAMAGSIEHLKSRQSTCSDTHIFLAKGNNEQYPGRQGKLVNAICSGLDNCDYEDILFYNPVESPYCDSVTQGAANGRTQIIAYNARCPNTKLVVSGYSQGAQIVGDILGGGGGTFFQNCQQPSNPALDANSPAGKQIYAAMVFGSTRHTAGQPHNVLTGGNNNGIFPRPPGQLAALNQYGSRYRDYCVSTDPVCAGRNGGSIVETHLNYFDVYTEEAAAWVKSMLLAAAPATPPSTAPSGIISTTSAPYPTHPAGNSTITSIPSIPTLTSSIIVTVTSCPVETSDLMTIPTITSHPATQAAGHPTTTSISEPTVTHPSNGTGPAPPTFTGAANSGKVGSSLLSLAAISLISWSCELTV